MATENVVLTLSGEFAEDVSTQYTVAKADTTDGEYGLATAATDDIVGVFQKQGKDGDACSIAILGISKVKTGGSISKGDRVTTDSNSVAVTTTTKDDKVLGVALEDGSSGDIIEVLLTPGMTYHIGCT